MNTSKVGTASATPRALRNGDQAEEPVAQPSPALIEISDDELDGVAGGAVNPTIRYGHYWPGCG